MGSDVAELVSIVVVREDVVERSASHGSGGPIHLSQLLYDSGVLDLQFVVLLQMLCLMDDLLRLNRFQDLEEVRQVLIDLDVPLLHAKS